MPGLSNTPTAAENRVALKALISTSEEWLMERILQYATRHDFTRYTSTLKEAWRASVEGLSASLLATLEACPEIPEFGPDEDWLNDPCGEFGRSEAEKHRNRGITLAMFLALMKYYRQSYLDLLHDSRSFHADRDWAELFMHRFFDRVEISFSQCWSGVETDSLTGNLQQQNRQLANEKNKFLTLFESYSLPCFLVNGCGYLDCMNLPAARIFGYGLTAGEHYYRADKDERLPDWLFDEIVAFAAVCSGEEVFEKDHQQGGVIRTFVIHLKRMLDVSGKYSGIVVSMVDVTLRIRDKQRLEKAHAELKEAQMQMLHREKTASIGRLASGMAHELNNPLAVILQNLQVVEQRLQPDFKRNLNVAEACGLDMTNLQNYLQQQRIDKMHQSIRDSGNRAATIVKKLLSFSQRSSSSPTPHDLRKMLDKAVLVMQKEGFVNDQYDFSQIRIVRDYTDPLPEILCHEMEIQQVLLGILENGALAMCSQAGSAEHCFVLRVKLDKQTVVLEIQDNGPGMTEDVQRQIFEPFFTTREVGESSGLGLSIAQKLIQKHSGQIDVASSPGEGSTFTFRLPVTGSD